MEWQEIKSQILTLNGVDRRAVWLHGGKTRVAFVNALWVQVYDHRSKPPVCRDCKGPDAVDDAVIAVKNLERKAAVA